MENRKKPLTGLCTVLYYLLVPVLYVALLRLFLFVYDAFIYSAGKNDLGKAGVFAVLVIFIFTPLYTAVAMRFSLLRWTVDPFAALLIPLTLFGGLVSSGHSGNLRSAILSAYREMADDGGIGFLYLGLVFVFALLWTISPARRRGESVSYRILRAIFGKKESGIQTGNADEGGTEEQQ